MATLVLVSWLVSRRVEVAKVLARQLVEVAAEEKLVLFKQRLMRSLPRPVIPAGRAQVTIGD